MQLIIITGRSGSGKTSALHVLEDAGFYCVDNLPTGLLPILTQELYGDEETDKLAIGVDVRNAHTGLQRFGDTLKAVRGQGIQTTIIYLDADDKTLFQRFNETRRKHPLSNTSTSLSEALKMEKELLSDIALHADLTLDTTTMNIHSLRSAIRERTNQSADSMAIQIQSFGFKHGTPNDSDFLFDVRCLPNPHWIANLRMQTGQDKEVQEFLDGEESFQDMSKDISDYLKKWIPAFEASNRRYMSIAIGCTGGQHRSVYMAETLQKELTKHFECIQLRHRELD